MTGGTRAAEADTTSEAGEAGEEVVSEECWERALDVGWRRTTTGVVLLPNDATTAFALGGLPALCWETLGRPMGLDALLGALATRLPDDSQVREEQVVDAVRFLVAIGVVRSCPPS